jgi:hypothetical protein
MTRRYILCWEGVNIKAPQEGGRCEGRGAYSRGALGSLRVMPQVMKTWSPSGLRPPTGIQRGPVPPFMKSAGRSMITRPSLNVLTFTVCPLITMVLATGFSASGFSGLGAFANLVSPWEGLAVPSPHQQCITARHWSQPLGQGLSYHLWHRVVFQVVEAHTSLV